MHDDEQKPPENPPPIVEDHNVIDEELQLAIRLYRDYVLDMTLKDIGLKHGIPKNKVWRLSQKYKWEQLRNTLAERAFKKAMTGMVKTTTALMAALDDDFNHMNERRKERHDKQFTTDERAHIRGLMSQFLKEKRLEDGTPTELPSNQPPAVQLVLPPGVQNFGLIPVPANAAIKTIESSVEDKPKVEPKIRIEDVEEPADD